MQVIFIHLPAENTCLGYMKTRKKYFRLSENEPRFLTPFCHHSIRRSFLVKFSVLQRLIDPFSWKLLLVFCELIVWQLLLDSYADSEDFLVFKTHLTHVDVA